VIKHITIKNHANLYRSYCFKVIFHDQVIRMRTKEHDKIGTHKNFSAPQSISTDVTATKQQMGLGD